ncbi:MAG: hypothetical protein NPMRTH4_660002 [Nitrosopumilales archaeon]|nr:MAG: hypothetical protein NPMRTH4_660002 [Nitrosopumilales archaeon]
MEKHPYARHSISGDMKTKWICGCFQTVDDFYKFCDKHDETLKKAINAQIDELDMTIVVNEK